METKSGIGVTKSMKPMLKSLATKFFLTDDAAFMACVSLAIAKELELSDTGPVERTWHIGGSRKELIEYVAWHFQTDDPVTKFEQLGHAGLRYVSEQLEKNLPFETIFSPANN